ncbi:MAG TPA: PASTA domain-containing protein [Pyrinomonadaceae bacterium]|jgi:serine/threonine-protein kinase
MTKTFTITTTASDTIKADNKGHAEAVFTVTNTSSRPVRGMARAAALESTRQEWLQVTGESDRDFPAGGTQQFVVTFDGPPPVPPAAKPGAAPTPATDTARADKYSFRLNVALATNPDEDFTEGQIVRVEMPQAAVVRETKPFPKWIFIPIAVVVLAIIGVVIWLLLRPSKPEAYLVPDVANTPQAEAQQTLETGCKAGTGCLLVAVTSIADNTIAKGNAIGTEPAAGSEVPVGSNINLIVSNGPDQTPAAETYKLPAVAALNQFGATKALLTGCKKGNECVQLEQVKVADSKVPAGMAIRTEPEAGSEVAPGDKVTLFVSTGPVQVAVRNVVGLTAQAAMDQLEKSCEPAPCVDVDVTRIPDNKVQTGLVIRTQPVPGTMVNAASKVTLFVSGGTDEVTIPLVRGKTSAEARALLAGACKPTPCLQITQNSQSNDSIEAGKAIGTNPPNGAAVKIGSGVVLNVSTGPEMRTVGTYTKISETAARQKIAADGFTVGAIKKIPMPFSTNQVIGQDPAAGQKRAKGTKINLTILSKI